jgi:3-hydroxyisobutyrate dehydrogenase
MPVAFIGLGGMGRGMAHRLVERGFPLVVHNRSREKAEELFAAGATVAESAGAAAAGADTVVLSLSDEAAVEDVLFTQVSPALKPGAVVIDTSTVSPTFSRQATERLAVTGAHRLEACVVGNPAAARAGGLRILTAGSVAHVEQAREVLDALGSEVLHLGEPGAAATMKLVMNLLLGAQVASLAEAVAYGVEAGLDRDLLLAAIGGSGFSSKVMSFRADLMRKRSYEPAAFRSRLMEKDLRLGLREAARLGVSMPVVEQAAMRFHHLVEAGDGDLDAAAVLELQQRDRGRPGVSRAPEPGAR